MNNEQHLCDYGCGQIANYQFKNGKWCCSEYFVKCPKIRKKKKGQVAWNKGKVYSKEERKKMSLDQTGKKHSEKTKKKIGIKVKGRKYSKEICIKHKLTIEQINKKYPIFSKIEEIRYKPVFYKERIIQIRCKNHNCKNSKEKNGWFNAKNRQIEARIQNIENVNNRNDGSYFYCCDECKLECPLFNLKSDPFRTISNLYTHDEYQTFRLQVLKREDYLCEYCEEKATHVHHSRPQKLEPGFALDPDFGVACCEKCHYKYGHKTGTECSTGNLASTICN